MSLDPVDLVSRVGLARILNVSENTARAIERRGEIEPVAVVDGRPVFSRRQAEAFKQHRDAQRSAVR